jgi:hypothetical protein
MFDPNKDVDLWGTYVESRSPKFKVHIGRGPAINAIKTAAKRVGRWPNDSHQIPDNVSLYKIELGTWVEVELIRHYKDAKDKIIKDQV